MRMLGLGLFVAAGALAACAGPADPSAPPTPTAYRTGSLIKQPDVAQPNIIYYGRDQFDMSPDWRVTSLRHTTPTITPPPPETSQQAPASQ